MNERRRVVVTGVGLVSPVGVGTEETWAALLKGRSGIAPIRLFDASRFSCRFAGEVKDFAPEKYIDRKDIKKMGRFIQFAMAATEFALAQSGLNIREENTERVGVYVGSGIGAFEVIEREHTKLLEGGPDRVSPFFINASIANLASGPI
jgi:3-oxoacyl-[acyl-carrier-protein] synthase II